VADYDVGAIALAVPSSSAPRATYRPAVSARNNGIHDALASGYLRVYSSGLLVFETELYSGTITPGATGNAQAVNYWTPETVGLYTIHAYLSCPLDQVESNNMLQPVTIEITGAAPPTPPTVTAHAAQHEEGGTDEVSIDGLQGRTADPQSPLDHASQHQAGGSDQLNVGSLEGVLASDQPAQPHGNPRHNPAMATAEQLSLHQGAAVVHSAATNLANRDLTGPEAGLVPSAQLVTGSAYPEHPLQAFLRSRLLGYPRQAALGRNAQPILVRNNTGETTLIELDIPASWLSEEMQFLIQLNGQLSTLTVQSTLLANLYLGNVLLSTIAYILPQSAIEPLLHIDASVLGTPPLQAHGNLMLSIHGATVSDITSVWDLSQARYPYPSTPTTISVTAMLISTDPSATLNSLSGFIRALHPIP
jgi:hypothetical protein